MARARRTSAILETARQRLNGLKSITPKPNLGPNLTPDSFEESVTGFFARLGTYNQHVAGLDQEQNELEAAEVGLTVASCRRSKRSSALTAASMKR